MYNGAFTTCLADCSLQQSAVVLYHPNYLTFKKYEHFEWNYIKVLARTKKQSNIFQQS